MSLLGDVFKDVDLGLMLEMISEGPGGFASSWDSFDLFSMGQGMHDQMFFEMAHQIMSQETPLDDRLRELGSTVDGGSVTIDDGSVTWAVPVPGSWGTEYYYSVTGVGVIDGVREIAPRPWADSYGPEIIA